MMRSYNLGVRMLAVICCPLVISSATAQAAVIGYQAAVLADNPVAFWRMGESSGTVMGDTSGFSRNGTYNANVVLGATGVGSPSDLAASFNGTNASASAPSDSAYDFLDYTLEAWVKFTGPLVPDMRIASRQGGQYWLLHTRETSAGVAQLSSYSSLDGVNGYAAGPNLNDGAFHHVAITRNTTADLISLYVDGLFVGSQVTTSNVAFTDTATVYVGSAFGTGQYFPGIIDEVALYGTALSAEQLMAHFEAGTFVLPAPEPSTGLLLGLGMLALAKRRRK